MNRPRLYIVTGKGGVGKTTVSHAITKLLIDEGVKAQYSSFDQKTPLAILEENTPYFDTTPEKSSEIYIGLKLNSPVIAKWIMKAPFFNALFQVLPPLGHMILLGHIIKELEDNPNKTIVIDSPASGHSMSMLSALTNFKEIFGIGLLVEDIHRMTAFMRNPKLTKVIVNTIPTEMSLEEGKELEQFYKDWGIKNSQMLVNNSLSSGKMPFQSSELIEKKKKIETSLISHLDISEKNLLPQIFSQNSSNVTHILKDFLKEVINE